MECPKCHKIIPDNADFCPHCKKVLTLVCPNCHTKSSSSVCHNCGYIILTKCAKCGRHVPVINKACKCGLSVNSSLAYNECETDEFASITIKFNALGAIRNLLSSNELYAKFLIKLKNLVFAQLKGIDGNVVIYNNAYVINLNKDLSFATSVNKAIRLSIKILNSFSGLNLRLQEELGTPLKISLIIHKKNAEELLVNKTINNNVKLLMLKNNNIKFLKGMQIILDQFCQDAVSNEYKTDSLYSLEQDGMSVVYYELLLENYILPPNKNDDYIDLIKEKPKNIKHNSNEEENPYNFKVFDIHSKCNFRQCGSEDLISNLQSNDKIIAIRGEKDLQIKFADLVKYYEKEGFNIIYVSCDDDLNYKPWGFFEKIFKEYYSLSVAKGLIDDSIQDKRYSQIKDFIQGKIINAATPEDARFTYMDAFVQFLKYLKNYVIIVDGFEYLDDTSIQTLDLYFDKCKNINTNFVFITNAETSVHSKIKNLLRTPLYKEITLLKNNIATLLSGIKEDAEDFIKSFYFEKIQDNFNGSKLYFEHAIKYLTDKDVLISFENKLIIKNSGSFILPKNMPSLIKTRLKAIGKNQDASMILAYSAFLGERLDFALLELLGINEIKKQAEYLEAAGFAFTKNNTIYINNYSLISPMLRASLKKEVQEVLVKNLIAKLGNVIDNTMLLTLMGHAGMYKEKYMLLWKNSQLAIQSGDYDAYLKNCLGFLSIIDKIDTNIPKETLDANKKEVFQNILMSLYSYSPAKIYSIENVLLMDAMQENDNEKIIKLSNLMLQGALIDSNYSNASSLLYNILSRMDQPSLIADEKLNIKFFLLSLVNIEILFNIGDYAQCISIGEDILKILKPDMLEKVKPASFSINFFVEHLMETFRLVGFAKILKGDSNLDSFFNSIKTALNEDLPDKDCIIALKNFLADKNISTSGAEELTAFSKVVILILQELNQTKKNYKVFAQNIYQAKLLASDLHQTQLEYICDMLIAYAYYNVGIKTKANIIYNDILQKSENSAIFNTNMLVRYLMASQNISSGNVEEALLIINDALAEIQKNNNVAKVFFAMFENLYINIAQEYDIPSINISFEAQKLLSVSPNGELKRLVKQFESIKEQEIEPLPEHSESPKVQEVSEETTEDIPNEE